MSNRNFKSRKILFLGEPETPRIVKWMKKVGLVKHEDVGGRIVIGCTTIFFASAIILMFGLL